MGAIRPLTIAVLLALAAPAQARWAIQHLDEYQMVLAGPRGAAITEAYVDGQGGWRLRVGCHREGGSAIMLGRRNVFEPPFGASFGGIASVGLRGAVIWEHHYGLDWTRGSYGMASDAQFIQALSRGDVVVFQDSRGRIIDRFPLAGSTAALGQVWPCGAARAAPTPAPRADAWRHESGDGVWATASVAMSGNRRVDLYCTTPDDRRFRAWASRDPDRNHVEFVAGRFRMNFTLTFWPELAQAEPEPDAERTLSLLIGGNRLEGKVQYHGLDADFVAPVTFDSPLLRLLAEGEQAGERLILREGERVLAAVPLAGFAAAMGRARRFCGG
jgi:hypothetical protein